MHVAIFPATIPTRRSSCRPRNLEQWLLSVFGKGICDAYLFPRYNRKAWNLPVRRLSMLWADRIPRPPPETILRSAIGQTTEGYLHQLYYHYPRRGGYQAISEGFAGRTGPVRFHYDVKSIRRVGRRWEITDGTSPLAFDELVSTIPIHELVQVARFAIHRSRAGGGAQPDRSIRMYVRFHSASGVTMRKNSRPFISRKKISL